MVANGGTRSALRYDRLHSVDRPPDNREPGQRDRDRILFTSAFRRLAGVTQVVAAEEGHIFHNRLTHSLEVAQVGRRLSEKLARDEHKLATKLGGIDPDVVEAACIAHDLGHPPFGHVAEQTLDELARSRYLPDGFEGNPQSFRIVTKLAFRSPKVVGLNLTRATLNALLKYPWTRGTAGKEHRKWGAYYTERQDFEFARQLSSLGDKSQSVEAAIMDWADDITYSVHDLEDFYRAGLIPLHLLVIDPDERLRFYQNAAERLSQVEDMSEERFTQLAEAFEKLISSVPLDAPYRGGKAERSALRTFTAGLIGRYVKNTRLQEPSASDSNPLMIPPGYKKEVKILKELTWHYVINNPALATQQFGQRQVIEELFRIFHDAVKDSRHRHILPHGYLEQVIETEETFPDGQEREQQITRIILDLISSMTERHALILHRRLTGISFGSALDMIEGR